jgi:ParB-like chromosome segregation protein Spo0J
LRIFVSRFDDQIDRAQVRDATSDVGTVTAHLRDLTPDPENRRQHSARNLAMIVDSLQRDGFGRSILIDENNTVLAGNATIDAAAEVGIERVRIVEASGHEIIAVRRRGLTDSQKRSLSISDNRAAELATWDLAQLRTDVDAGLDLGFFFEPAELADLLGSDAPTPRFEPEAPAHRLDELADNTTCPACGHSWHQERR